MKAFKTARNGAAAREDDNSALSQGGMRSGIQAPISPLVCLDTFRVRIEKPQRTSAVV